MKTADPLFWLLPWEPSAAVMAVALVTAALYIHGCARCRPSYARQASFWLGWLSFCIVSHTQFDYYAEHAFFMHRLQHGVLHHMAPFLIALARPGAVLAAGVPKSWQQRITAGLNWHPLRRAINILNRPPIAAIIFCSLILFWLLPPVHFLAMLDVRLYRLMNWSMAINGLMFWNLVLNNYCLRPVHLSPGRRILMMLAIVPPQIAIGMLIFAAPHPLYPIYSLCGSAFDISPLADQQIGGLLLWIPAAMMSVTGAVLVMAREWLPASAANAAALPHPALPPRPLHSPSSGEYR